VVNLCEHADIGAEEPAPRLTRMSLAETVDDVIAGERLVVGDHDTSEDIPMGMNAVPTRTTLSRHRQPCLQCLAKRLLRAVSQARLALSVQKMTSAGRSRSRILVRVCPRLRRSIYLPSGGGTTLVVRFGIGCCGPGADMAAGLTLTALMRGARASRPLEPV
jgi:hypothetical protein